MWSKGSLTFLGAKSKLKSWTAIGKVACWIQRPWIQVDRCLSLVWPEFTYQKVLIYRFPHVVFVFNMSEWNHAKETHSQAAVNGAMEMVPDVAVSTHVQVMFLQSLNTLLLVQTALSCLGLMVFLKDNLTISFWVYNNKIVGYMWSLSESCFSF